MKSSPAGKATTAPMDSLISTMAPDKVVWGRQAEAVTKDSLKSIVMITAAPVWVLLNWIALTRYDGSMTAAVVALGKNGLLDFLKINQLQPTLVASLGYIGWFLFQAFLFVVLPGAKCFGQRTPGGLLLAYVTNGLNAWMLTHILFFLGAFAGVFDAAIIANHWEGLLVAANVSGFVLAFLFQVKGYYMPSYKEDQKMSGKFFIIF